MITLLCPECRRENEPERLYCHDCGTRLDRSVFANSKPTEEDPKDTHRRVRAMFDPRRAKLRQSFFRYSKLVLGALFLAGLIQMLRPPDLPPRSKTPILPTQINLDLENAAVDPRVGPLRYTEEQVNAYLGYALKGKQAALSKILQFERAVVAFEEGLCSITAERSLSGFSVFATASYAVSLQEGVLVAASRGGRLGRIPVHPALMDYAQILFADLQVALDRERKSILKLEAIEFHPKTVALLPKKV